MSLHAENKVKSAMDQRKPDLQGDRILELNYRVANSLQLVSTFLSLQEREAPDPLAKQALHTAASRVAAVGSIQRAVLGGHNAMIDLGPFLRGLCADLEVLTGLPIEVEADAIVVKASVAESVAVVVSELVVNAAGHDIEAAERAVTVDCRRVRSGDRVMLTVVDHGSGPLHGFEHPMEGVGMIILRSAEGLLNGVLRFDKTEEATASLVFRAPRSARKTLYS